MSSTTNASFAKSGDPRPLKPGPGAPLKSDHTMPISTPTRLRGLSDIRRFFYRNEKPIYFISATNFNLIGIDEWVRHFMFINSIDCFDGDHPRIGARKLG